MVTRGGQNDNNTKENPTKLHLQNREEKNDNQIPSILKDKHWHMKYIQSRQFEAKIFEEKEDLVEISILFSNSVPL